MSVSDRSVTPVLLDLLDCLRTALAETPKPPANVSLRPGVNVDLMLSQVRDECCEGTGWVRPVTIYTSATFPIPDGTYSPCGPAQWAVTVELGVARCAPTPGPNAIPSAEQWTALTLQVQDDAAAVRRAVCCYMASDPDRMVFNGPWLPAAVEGGCVGGAQQVTIAIGHCDCAAPADTGASSDAVVNAGVVSGRWG